MALTIAVLNCHRLADLLQVVDAGAGGGGEHLDVAVVEHAPEQTDCLSTTSVSFSSDESATRLLSTPVDSTTRRLVSTYTFMRHERKPQAMRTAGTRKTSSSQPTQRHPGPPDSEQDDEREHGGGEEDPLDHLGDEEDPVVTLGVEDLLVGSQLLLQVLDAHATSLAVVSAATYHEGRAA